MTITATVAGVGHHQIRPYDPAWATRAADLVERLSRMFGADAVRIDHVGSTSVPGMGARPIIDIQLSVRDVYDTRSYDARLRTLGYRYFWFPELPVDDYLVYDNADGTNTEHIAVCEAGSLQEFRHLAFRDFLCAHPWAAQEYEQVKREAATSAVGVREAYAAAKRDCVQRLEREALRWAATHRPFDF